jgi:hypothetical protein
MAGDFFNSDQYPCIHREDGGNRQRMLDGMSLLIGMAGPNTKIVSGYGTLANRNKAIAARPTADYDAKFSDSQRMTIRFLMAP